MPSWLTTAPAGIQGSRLPGTFPTGFWASAVSALYITHWHESCFLCWCDSGRHYYERLMDHYLRPNFPTSLHLVLRHLYLRICTWITRIKLLLQISFPDTEGSPASTWTSCTHLGVLHARYEWHYTGSTSPYDLIYSAPSTPYIPNEPASASHHACDTSTIQIKR